MPFARCHDVELCYETLGDPAARPLVLIMGMGRQLIHWPDPLCQRLASRGHYVIRFDNRDMGRSTSFADAGPPDMEAVVRAVVAGERAPVAYTLTDLARDTAALITALGLPAAHLAGVSLGGMVAQTVALEHPGHVLSLTSLLSTTGRPGLPGASAEGARVLGQSVPTEPAAYVEHAVAVDRFLTGPHMPFDEESARAKATLSLERGHASVAVARQMAAVIASGSRHERLPGVTVPTLVVHGDSDPLIDVAGGRDTAACVPGARYLEIPGLGHTLAEPIWDTLVDAISALTGGR